MRIMKFANNKLILKTDLAKFKVKDISSKCLINKLKSSGFKLKLDIGNSDYLFLFLEDKECIFTNDYQTYRTTISYKEIDIDQLDKMLKGQYEIRR